MHLQCVLFVATTAVASCKLDVTIKLIRRRLMDVHKERVGSRVPARQPVERKRY